MLKRLIFINLISIIIFGCANSYKVTWKHRLNNLEYDLYAVEVDSGAVIDTTLLLSNYHLARLNNKSYIYTTDKNNKFVVIGLIAIDPKGKSKLVLSKYFRKKNN